MVFSTFTFHNFDGKKNRTHDHEIWFHFLHHETWFQKKIGLTLTALVEPLSLSLSLLVEHISVHPLENE
jgi:hypothetical protein